MLHISRFMKLSNQEKNNNKTKPKNKININNIYHCNNYSWLFQCQCIGSPSTEVYCHDDVGKPLPYMETVIWQKIFTVNNVYYTLALTSLFM